MGDSIHGLPKARVLVVDDNPDNCTLSAMVLRTWGHLVVAACCGAEALSLLDEFKPDVVLLDIAMPRMDGYELARRIRQNPVFAGIQIVAITGHGLPEARELSRQAGIDHHLLKPIDLPELAQILKNTVRPGSLSTVQTASLWVRPGSRRGGPSLN